MEAIERMERGKLCQMGGRPHYNHQTWRHICNQVRYVPKDEMAQLKEDIAGYQLFTKLAEQYADESWQLVWTQLPLPKPRRFRYPGRMTRPFSSPDLKA